MNITDTIKSLENQYKYHPLPPMLSVYYRNMFLDGIPHWLRASGSNDALYTIKGSPVCSQYDRIVIGDYGAYVEFSDSQACKNNFVIQSGQEFRKNNPRYLSNVKYLWLTINDGSRIKIYQQKRTVNYADYVVGKYYVSVYEVSNSN